MALAEDDEIFAVLATAATITPNTGADLITIPGSLSKAALADLYGIIAGRQLVPSSYVLNSRKYSDILKFSSNDLDQVSLNVTVESGQFGVFFGTRMILSTRAPLTKVYCTTTPDKLGRIPERKAVEVKIFDNIPGSQYDIVGWEQIGIGCHNPAGVAVGTIVP